VLDRHGNVDDADRRVVLECRLALKSGLIRSAQLVIGGRQIGADAERVAFVTDGIRSPIAWPAGEFLAIGPVAIQDGLRRDTCVDACGRRDTRSW